MLLPCYKQWYALHFTKEIDSNVEISILYILKAMLHVSPDYLKDHNYSTIVGFAAEGVYYKCL